MRSIIKKNKNIVLGILFIAIIVCTPFLFGEEGCDDGFHEVANSVDQNIQNDADNNKSSVVIEQPTVVDGRLKFSNRESFTSFANTLNSNTEGKQNRKNTEVIPGFKSHYSINYEKYNPPYTPKNLRTAQDSANVEPCDEISYYEALRISPELAQVLNEKREYQFGDSIYRRNRDYSFIYHINQQNDIENIINSFYSDLKNGNITFINMLTTYREVFVSRIIYSGFPETVSNSNSRESYTPTNLTISTMWGNGCKRLDLNVSVAWDHNYIEVQLNVLTFHRWRNWFGNWLGWQYAQLDRSVVRHVVIQPNAINAGVINRFYTGNDGYAVRPYHTFLYRRGSPNFNGITTVHIPLFTVTATGDGESQTLSWRSPWGCSYNDLYDNAPPCVH